MNKLTEGQYVDLAKHIPVVVYKDGKEVSSTLRAEVKDVETIVEKAKEYVMSRYRGQHLSVAVSNLLNAWGVRTPELRGQLVEVPPLYLGEAPGAKSVAPAEPVVISGKSVADTQAKKKPKKSEE